MENVYCPAFEERIDRLACFLDVQELQQRYNRFRVEVQTAVDRCEAGATYASLARRVMSRETTASNAGANGLAMKSSKASKSSDAHGTKASPLAAGHPRLQNSCEGTCP